MSRVRREGKMAKAAENVTQVSDDAGWETIVEPFGETYAFETPGDVLIGTYTGSKTVETDDLNNPGEKRNQTVYDITDENGKKWSVWESYNIAKAMADLEPGTLVRIEFKGKVSIGNGRSVKQFAVATRR